MVSQRQLEQLEKAIIKVYSEARFELTQKITKELADFVKEDKRKKKSLPEKEYKYWRRTQASRIAGMKELQNQLTQSVLNADKVAAELINGHLSIFYSEGFNYGTYQVEKLTNINTSFALYDKETVRRLLEDNPDLLPFVEIDETKTKRWSKAHINSAITQGVLQGESMDDIAKRLSHVVKMNENSAIRNARTATMGAENGGHLGSYQRARDRGIEVKKRWSCTFDSRTRHSHVLMDGETVDVDKLFSNGVRYPADPEGRAEEVYNCRCALVPELVRFPSDDSWKYEMDIEGMSYEKWKEYHAKKQAEIEERRKKRAKE